MDKKYKVFFVSAILSLIYSACSFAATTDCQQIRQKFQPDTANLKQVYSMASCAAHDGKKGSAFDFLTIATKKGYHDLELLKMDSDFENLHQDPRWQQTLSVVEETQKKYLKTVNAELYEIYVADQVDRLTPDIDWSVVSPRDHAREARVKELVESNLLTTSDDYYHAALVYQHGFSAEFYRQANIWSLHAVELDPTNDDARWLACAAEDRYLWSTGKPQIWGTQFMKPFDTNAWSMEPFDRTKKTDEERVAMKVRTIAESDSQVQLMNAEENANK